MLNLELPYPPSINHAYMSVAFGKRVLKPDVMAYRSLIGYVASAAVARYGLPHYPYTMYVEVYTPDRRRRDLDNLLKVLQDGITHGINVDDTNITTLAIKKAGVVKDGKVLVSIQSEFTQLFSLQQAFDLHPAVVWNAL